MDPSVTDSEIKGVEKLSMMEKKHLLAQLARDRKMDPLVGPWEIINVRRGEWKPIKDFLVQPVEIDMNDTGKNEFLVVWLDITYSERELEAGKKNQLLNLKS